MCQAESLTYRCSRKTPRRGPRSRCAALPPSALVDLLRAFGGPCGSARRLARAASQRRARCNRLARQGARGRGRRRAHACVARCAGPSSHRVGRRRLPENARRTRSFAPGALLRRQSPGLSMHRRSRSSAAAARPAQGHRRTRMRSHARCPDAGLGHRDRTSHSGIDGAAHEGALEGSRVDDRGRRHRARPRVSCAPSRARASHRGAQVPLLLRSSRPARRRASSTSAGAIA
jgi:hypothetical protein